MQSVKDRVFADVGKEHNAEDFPSSLTDRWLKYVAQTAAGDPAVYFLD